MYHNLVAVNFSPSTLMCCGNHINFNSLCLLLTTTTLSEPSYMFVKIVNRVLKEIVKTYPIHISEKKAALIEILVKLLVDKRTTEDVAEDMKEIRNLFP